MFIYTRYFNAFIAAVMAIACSCNLRELSLELNAMFSMSEIRYVLEILTFMEAIAF